jgi:hypothetical protein
MKPAASPITSSLDMHACALPHFGHVVNWVLLGSCFLLASLSFEISTGTRQSPVTMLSWLPSEILHAPWGFTVFRALLVLGATLWLCGKFTPWSCWLTTIGFTGLWSWHMETTTNGAHIFNVSNQLLCVQSLWMTWKHAEMQAAIREQRYWTTPLYPNWAFWLGIGFLGLFHTYAGLAKLTFSGWSWANGTSLQLWAYWDGRPGSWTRELIINHRSFALVMQWATLIFETAGILALFDRRLRLIVGLAILSFYMGVLLTFDYGFHLNFLLTALYHLPFDRWLTSGFRMTATESRVDTSATNRVATQSA